MNKRTLFIGDVHGCYDELISLCERMGLRDEDHLYFVGDLVNKWPKSLEVVEFVRNRPNTWSVIGNHEYFLLQDALPIQAWKHQNWINIEYEKAEPLREILSSQREWLLTLPHIIEREDFIVVHGWLHPDLWLDTPREIATLIRIHEGKAWYDYYTGSKPIIYGHWAVEWLRVRANTIGLDTGCCFGWHLTAYCLETWEYWQARANAVYKEPSHWKPF